MNYSLDLSCYAIRRTALLILIYWLQTSLESNRIKIKRDSEFDHIYVAIADVSSSLLMTLEDSDNMIAWFPIHLE